jgi:membrane-associated phospholipid phosphatase
MSAFTDPARLVLDRHPWLRTTWPLDRRDALTLVAALVATIAVFTVMGMALTEWLAPNAVTRIDDSVVEWSVAQRSAGRDDLAFWGALLSATLTKIVITAAVAVGALAVWRRWHEALLVAMTLVFQATAFIVVTFIVGRPRPDVDRLEVSPVDSSFPSGHVAAATVYGAFAFVVCWHSGSRIVRAAAAIAVAVVAGVVGWARVHQGMHHLSDVVMGIVLGLVSLALCRWVIGAPHDAAAVSQRGSGAPVIEAGFDADRRVGTASGRP